MTRFLPTLALLFALPASAQTVVPPGAQEVGVEERLGQTIPTHLEFTDSTGKRVRLSDFLEDDKPLLLVLAYYRCPMLCSLILDGVVESLQKLDWKPGDEFRVVTLSFDTTDGVHDASRKQESVLDKLGRPGEKDAWPFLIGEEAEVRALTQSLGFFYQYDEETGELAHASVIFAISPEGKITRYLYGVKYPPQDIKLAMMEASEGKIGSFLDKFLMLCYRYDPATRKYGLYILGFMRVGALLIFLVVGAWLYRLWRREREEPNEE